MRILLVTVRSDFGGGPKHVDQIISGLSSEFEFFIAAPKGAPFGDLWMSSNMVNGFIEIPFRKFSVISLYRLLQFVRRNRISVIHSHGNGAGVYSRFLKMINPSLRVIHTFHGIAEGCMGSVKTLVFRTLSFFSDWSVFVSSGEQQIGVTQGFVREGKHSVIYNGINPPAGDRSDRSLRKCPFCVLTLSRFDYQKNMHLAYEIAKRMMVYDFIKFIWVGDGPDYQELHSLSKEEKVLNIQFVGFSEQPQRYLSASDLYLSTSRFEGLP